jgi:transcriptional regulator with XRE-family HTH domain
MSLTEQVREAIRECGVSRYQIARETGLPEAALSRFMTGKKTITLETLERLHEFISVSAKPARRKARA